MIRNRNRKSKGFTLIEVVAVMAILAILAAVLIPNVTGYITEARKFEVIEQARKVIIAAETVKIKSPTVIKDSDLINALVSKSAGLLKDEDINLLNSGVNKIIDCYNLVDVEKYTFTIDGERKLDKVTPIPPVTPE